MSLPEALSPQKKHTLLIAESLSRLPEFVKVRIAFNSPYLQNDIANAIQAKDCITDAFSDLFFSTLRKNPPLSHAFIQARYQVENMPVSDFDKDAVRALISMCDGMIIQFLVDLFFADPNALPHDAAKTIREIDKRLKRSGKPQRFQTILSDALAHSGEALYGGGRHFSGQLDFVLKDCFSPDEFEEFKNRALWPLCSGLNETLHRELTPVIDDVTASLEAAISDEVRVVTDNMASSPPAFADSDIGDGSPAQEEVGNENWYLHISYDPGFERTSVGFFKHTFFSPHLLPGFIKKGGKSIVHSRPTIETADDGSLNSLDIPGDVIAPLYSWSSESLVVAAVIPAIGALQTQRSQGFVFAPFNKESVNRSAVLAMESNGIFCVMDEPAPDKHCSDARRAFSTLARIADDLPKKQNNNAGFQSLSAMQNTFQVDTVFAQIVPGTRIVRLFQDGDSAGIMRYTYNSKTKCFELLPLTDLHRVHISANFRRGGDKQIRFYEFEAEKGDVFVLSSGAAKTYCETNELLLATELDARKGDLSVAERIYAYLSADAGNLAPSMSGGFLVVQVS